MFSSSKPRAAFTRSRSPSGVRCAGHLGDGLRFCPCATASGASSKTSRPASRLPGGPNDIEERSPFEHQVGAVDPAAFPLRSPARHHLHALAGAPPPLRGGAPEVRPARPSGRRPRGARTGRRLAAGSPGSARRVSVSGRLRPPWSERGPRAWGTDVTAVRTLTVRPVRVEIAAASPNKCHGLARLRPDRVRRSSPLQPSCNRTGRRSAARDGTRWRSAAVAPLGNRRIRDRSSSPLRPTSVVTMTTFPLQSGSSDVRSRLPGRSVPIGSAHKQSAMIIFRLQAWPSPLDVPHQ